MVVEVKKQYKNPHAVALGRLGGSVCSPAKKAATKDLLNSHSPLCSTTAVLAPAKVQWSTRWTCITGNSIRREVVKKSIN